MHIAGGTILKMYMARVIEDLNYYGEELRYTNKGFNFILQGYLAWNTNQWANTKTAADYISIKHFWCKSGILILLNWCH